MSSESQRVPATLSIEDVEVIEHEEPVRIAAKRIFAIARDGGSILTDHDVWTTENLETLLEKCVRAPDVSGASFFEKIEKQLHGVDDGARLLFAEIFILQMLPIAQYKSSTKMENIDRILKDAVDSYEIPRYVREAFESPVFGGGMAFSLRRFHQLALMIELFLYMKTLPEEEVALAYAEPLEWRTLISNCPGTREASLRGSLTYLGHPEYFFPIVSQDHKQKIVDAFFPKVTGTSPSDDVDVDLAELRALFSPESGETPQFYSPPLSEYWMEQQVDPDPDPEPVADTIYTVESIVNDGAFHGAAQLQNIVGRWQETRNIVLQGAPGTGKTWLAKRLAYALIGQKLPEAVRSVQFHPGTSYEDFVRGWRPGADGKLTLVDGPLIQHAELARKNPDIPHVLIIEEFNRGNPAQALGEMLTLLENTKRSKQDALELTYMHTDEAAFHLPENLYVVGTMNTADRSLALVDFALRRRFAFFEVEPSLGEAWKAHLTRQFRGEKPALIDELGRRIETLNAQIAEDPSLGKAFRMGHAYFTPGNEATDLIDWFRSVVRSSIEPQLAEYWYDNAQRADDAVNALLKEL
ncbi:AAA family ATPase [Leucobacter sp. cx-42]|uniref:McrB family protein n=1 Tax=unclassified Leucobacter TaxID=2621730 RepID=UPI00165D735B|nr:MULTISPECIES: AAA family ATPase [unclassified Leucobacter]MBC9955306.1 AAA family ATPase [Leucobacter sp. cx-42]